MIEFISAGAGSGKTYRLTSIVAEALETGAARPSAVLATTFTVRAATELSDRIRAGLLGKGKVALAASIAQARIGTVNGLCGQLLKRFCFELGLSPDQTVLSDGQAKRLLKIALSDTLDVQGQAELSALSQRLGIDHDHWSSSITAIVDAALGNDIRGPVLTKMAAENADAMLAHWPDPVEGVDFTRSLTEALVGAHSELISRIVSTRAAGTEPTKVLVNGCNEIQRIARALKDDRWIWPDWLAAANIGAGVPAAAVLTPVIEAAHCHGKHPQFHRDVRRYLELAFGLAAKALDTYATAKRTLGVVDFIDQESLLLRAIRDHASVRDALRDELDLVMVDEFQDTSPLQLAIFVELARLAKRSVWVGDPKQAIYGFRGTDARLVADVLSAIPVWGGVIGEPLRTSRRSTPGLVALTNAVFESQFLPALQPDDVALRSARARATQPELMVWTFESRKIATDYLALGSAVSTLLSSGRTVVDKSTDRDRPLAPGDIAVLCHKHDEVDLAVASLARWGVACASPRAGLLATPEALLVMACLRRLLDASDTVASALILTLADGVPVSEWLIDRLEYLSQPEAVDRDWRTSGSDAHPLLARLEALRPQLSALTPLEAIRLAKAESQVARLCGIWSSSPHEAATRLANVASLLDMAVAFEDECLASRRAATVGGLLRWLSERADAEEDQRATSAGGAVSVLTQHAAKGLEWPVVIVSSLNATARTALWSVRARTVGAFDPNAPLKNRFIHFWPTTWGRRSRPQSAVDAEAGPLGRQMQAEAVAESRRLLYVSLTRARDVNVLLAHQRPGGVGVGWLDEVDAGWVIGESGPLTLPCGESIDRVAVHWPAADADAGPPPREPVPCHWFDSTTVEPKRPLWVRPSLAEGGEFQVVDSARVGARINLSAAVEMAQLGTALHLCLARAGVCGTVETEAVERLLKAWRVDHAVSVTAVVTQLSAFFDWLRARWPGASMIVEAPVEAAKDDGARVRGRVDLLLDTSAGWILIDHKAHPRGGQHDQELVNAHGPQLEAYALAVARATGRRVVERWLYLPVAGRVICVGGERDE